jgi:glutathione S-transferase
LSFSDRETRSDRYKAINPRGKVPCIREGDVVVRESLAILAWLDRRFDHGPMLFGTDPAQVGQVWAACLEYENDAEPAISTVVRPLLFGAAPEVGALELAGELVADHLDDLEQRIGDRAAVVGTKLTAADIVWYCGMRFLDRGLSRPRSEAHNLGLWPLVGRRPGLEAWARRVEAIDGFAATVPPHWLESSPPSTVALT